MLIERELTESDLPLLALIDRSELVEACYRVENGELVLYPVRFDMRGYWKNAGAAAVGYTGFSMARHWWRRWLWITGLFTIRV